MQTTEVRETRHDDAVAGSVFVGRLIYYVFGFIIALLTLRIILLLFAANQGNGFVDFIYWLSGIFASPFYGIFSYTPTYGASVFEISSVVAIVVYALISWGLTALVTIGSRNRDEV